MWQTGSRWKKLRPISSYTQSSSSSPTPTSLCLPRRQWRRNPISTLCLTRSMMCIKDALWQLSQCFPHSSVEWALATTQTSPVVKPHPVSSAEPPPGGRHQEMTGQDTGRAGSVWPLGKSWWGSCGTWALHLAGAQWIPMESRWREGRTNLKSICII
jgi:hypothetical protein